jgi:hypothetical protein
MFSLQFFNQVEIFRNFAAEGNAETLTTSVPYAPTSGSGMYATTSECQGNCQPRGKEDVSIAQTVITAEGPQVVLRSPYQSVLLTADGGEPIHVPNLTPPDLAVFNLYRIGDELNIEN